MTDKPVKCFKLIGFKSGELQMKYVLSDGINPAVFIFSDYTYNVSHMGNILNGYIAALQDSLITSYDSIEEAIMELCILQVDY